MEVGVKAGRPEPPDDPPEETRRRAAIRWLVGLRKKTDPKAVVIECGIIALVGAILAGVSIGMLFVQYGEQHGEHLKFGVADVVSAGAAGIVAAAIIRLNVLLHRRWKRTIGRFTAAAALCAVAAVAGVLVVLIPSECPGGLFTTGRCGVREAAAWGQVAGLLALVNFGLAGMSLLFWRLVRALARGVRDVVRDGTLQGVSWARALKRVVKHRSFRRTEDGTERGPQDKKGRPTPRRADAEQARRDRNRRDRLRADA
ncbi:hypothetical protein E1281_33900 [Actinomadura sp. KC345]|uniref:hypothetical protein n=1 Tax=Actinomadura sp. KC345 TaxID=2530371 RepID=UPI00105045AE|nr:hypothetical protein [Actinomadura sp. KC345]TDC44457.1 hypothetical protein E1281_33900 [Actinomadura sp. KC345]